VMGMTDGFWNVVKNDVELFSELLLSELLKNEGDDMIIDIDEAAKLNFICIESLYLLLY
jgi:hypothetical protein